jgi:putative ABC transport system permease protein
MHLLGDLRFSLRFLKRNPAFTLVAVFTLALGIGATATIFSFANTLLLQPLPYQDPDRLVLVTSQHGDFRGGSPSLPDYRDLKALSSSFTGMALARNVNKSLTDKEAEPERLRALLVSSDLFSVLGIQPVLGRGFLPAEDRSGANRTALLSDQLWRRRFSADPHVLGRVVTLDGEGYEIIGVLPAALATESLGAQSTGDLWLPIGLFFGEMPVNDRSAHLSMAIAARLKPGVSLTRARLEMTALGERLAALHPDSNRGNHLVLASLREEAVGKVRPAVLILLIGVGFVLLITCANLAGLLLARALARPREMALRTALGASRRELIRQLLTENLILAALGGACGLLTAYWALRLLPAILPGDLRHVQEIAINGRVLAFTAGLSLLTGLLFGLVPAIQTSRANLQQVFAAEGGGRSSGSRRPQLLRNLLVAAELALALVLLIGANLMLRTLRGYQQIDPGFRARNVLTLRLALPQAKYREEARWVGFYDEALPRIQHLHGIESAAVTSLLPLAFGNQMSSVLAQDRPVVEDPPIAVFQVVSPDYFRTMGISLRAGRGFNPGDDDRAAALPVAMISESLARTLWSDRNPNPIGRRISFESNDKDERRWREVVGMVADIRQSALDGAPKIAIYVPIGQPPIWFAGHWPVMALAVKSGVDPASETGTIRRALLEVEPTLTIFEAQPMEKIVAAEYARPRMITVLLGIFALLALVQAVLGVYGVIAFAVSQRRQEFGIRTALGAQPAKLVALVLKKGVLLCIAGTLVGLLASFGLTRLMSNLLYGVKATDPLTFLGLASSLVLVATVATLIPAVRATRGDPAAALRLE